MQACSPNIWEAEARGKWVPAILDCRVRVWLKTIKKDVKWCKYILGYRCPYKNIALTSSHMNAYLYRARKLCHPHVSVTWYPCVETIFVTSIKVRWPWLPLETPDGTCFQSGRNGDFLIPSRLCFLLGFVGAQESFRLCPSPWAPFLLLQEPIANRVVHLAARSYWCWPLRQFLSRKRACGSMWNAASAGAQGSEQGTTLPFPKPQPLLIGYFIKNGSHRENGIFTGQVNAYFTYGRREAENISFHHQCQGPQKDLGSHTLL